MASSSGVNPSPGSSSIMTDILAHLPYPCLVDPSVELDRIDRGSHRAHPRPMTAPTPIRPDCRSRWPQPASLLSLPGFVNVVTCGVGLVIAGRVVPVVGVGIVLCPVRERVVS